MIDINSNGVIEVSLLVTCLAVFPWLGIFTVLKPIIDHYFLSPICCGFSSRKIDISNGCNNFG